jgi:hypothetical protein
MVRRTGDEIVVMKTGDEKHERPTSAFSHHH